MENLKLIYFEGCPNVEKMRTSLSVIGQDFDEIRQDDLSASDTLKHYSSPTLLRGDDVLFGSKSSSAGACTLSIPTPEQIQERLELNPSTKKAKLLASTGSIGSIITFIICPVCKPALAAILATMGLGVVVNATVLQSLLIVFLAIAIGGLLWSYLRVHRNAGPLILGTIMSICFYSGRYVYFSEMQNNVLTYGGIAGLLGATLWNMKLKKSKACSGSCNSVKTNETLGVK